MARGQDMLFRLWYLSQSLPSYPQKKSLKVISIALCDEGGNVTERTSQRGLQQLSSSFQFYCVGRFKPFGWCWSQYAHWGTRYAATIEPAVVALEV